MLIAIIALVIGAALYVMNMVGLNINANVICSLGVLIVGFAMLIKGADLFVEGASKIAAKFKIPQIVIGLTIVAMGTSAPEAAISISAAFQDAAAISIGNVVGSNIMNILLILGVSALITNLKIKPNTLKFEIPFVVFITAVLLLLGWIGGGLDKIDGVIMLVLFAAFLGYLFYLYKKGDDSSADEVPQLTEKDKIPVLILITLIGLVSIVLGSDLTVASAKSIAQVIGVDDRTISRSSCLCLTLVDRLDTCTDNLRNIRTRIYTKAQNCGNYCVCASVVEQNCVYEQQLYKYGCTSYYEYIQVAYLSYPADTSPACA